MSRDLGDCSYCPTYRVGADPEASVHLDERWAVVHGPAAATRPGGLKIVARRHFVDFHEMDDAEAGSFGDLLRRLDAAIRTVTGAERVHLVSTRDRVQHFHAWLYPRYAEDPLRGTAFLAAPQQATAEEVTTATAALRRVLGGGVP